MSDVDIDVTPPAGGSRRTRLFIIVAVLLVLVIVVGIAGIVRAVSGRAKRASTVG